MQYIRFLIIAITFMLPLIVSAQKVQSVSGTYTYYAPVNVTIEQAKHTALERAKIQILADKFGTIIGQTNISRIAQNNGVSNVSVHSLGSSEVKGEWIETIGEPEYKISFEQDMLVVTVNVSGKVREIVSAPIEFKAKILRNGVEDKFESEEFRSGDDLFLSFHSPVKGYLTVYLYDGDENVFCLLPYSGQNDGKVEIDANQQYVFFSAKHHSKNISYEMVDEYTMTASQAMELNRIYVIFSPHLYTKALDHDGSANGLPRMLDYLSFQTWLSKCRKHDTDMQVVIKDIVINR